MSTQHRRASHRRFTSRPAASAEPSASRRISGSEGVMCASLVRRARRGDVGAEEEIVTRYAGTVRRQLRRLLKGRPEAEDFFQETFHLGLAKIRRGELRDPACLPAFLRRLAHHLVIHHFRLKARRRTDVDSETAHDTPTFPADQLDRLLDAERASRIRRVLDDLPVPRDREILYRFYLAEDPKADICRDLDLPVDHFRRVLHRARKRYLAVYREADQNWKRKPPARV